MKTLTAIIVALVQSARAQAIDRGRDLPGKLPAPNNRTSLSKSPILFGEAAATVLSATCSSLDLAGLSAVGSKMNY